MSFQNPFLTFLIRWASLFGCFSVSYRKCLLRTDEYVLRDVTTGATGATEVAPKFSDALTLSQPRGADSAHHYRGRSKKFSVVTSLELTIKNQAQSYQAMFSKYVMLFFTSVFFNFASIKWSVF